jgi:hypothetical protein
MRQNRYRLLVAALSLVLIVGGCTTLGEIAALRLVDFALGGTSQGRLAGIDLSSIRGYEDLRSTDALRIVDALRQRRLPLEFTLHVDAENPSSNRIAARLVKLEWTLLLEDRETVSGILDREYELPPGRTIDIPLRIELDLLRFYEDNARDLVELAASIAGRGGDKKNIKLTAWPTIATPIGPLEMGGITIVSRDVGR